MKSRSASSTYRPFENLRTLIRQHTPEHSFDGKSVSSPVKKSSTDIPLNDDHALFLEAMDGVIPMDRGNVVEKICTGYTPGRINEEDPSEKKYVEKLKQLILTGKGFNIADTDEYIEGTGKGIDPKIASLLHQGKYAIQDYIDLHGLGVNDAKDTFDHFLKTALANGKKQVLIVHGRGLSSPNKPVLKMNVQKWLSTGYWKKRVIAFASARSHDGGAGGTYVLLKNHP